MRTLRPVSLGLFLTACNGTSAGTTATTDSTDTGPGTGTSFTSTSGGTQPTSSPTSSTGAGTSTGLTGTSTGTTASSGEPGSSSSAGTTDTGGTDPGSTGSTGTDTGSTGTDTGSTGTDTGSSTTGSSTGGPVCGDGVVEGDEACDEGKANGPGQACNAACALNVCGDGDKGPLEFCDDGNDVDDDACPNNCMSPQCGDGLVGPGEPCDDGNDVNTDACTNVCTLAACGDGFVQPGNAETCDLGVANDDAAACLKSCKSAKCGDALVWAGMEACDDGNADETDACTAACKAPTCSDGQKNGGETGVDCGGPACAACPMLLLLGGNPTKMLGARYDGAAWTTADIAAPAVDPVDVAITSDGVGVGVFRYTKIGDPKDRQLQYVLYKNGAWTAPAAIGASLTRAAPTLSAAGKGAHLVFQGEDYQFYYAGYSGAVWGPTAEMIGSYGPGPGSVATLGADAEYVFHDGDKSNNLYSRARNPVWQPQQLIDTQSSFNRAAVVIALGAVAELLAVHTLNANDQVRFSARKAGAWAPAANLAGATTPHSPALAALPGGQAILALRGVDNRIYTTTYDAGANTWTPVTAVNANPISDRPPAVTAGLAGAEVELVYLDTASKTVRHIRRNKGVWSAPVAVGATALDNVALTRGP